MLEVKTINVGDSVGKDKYIDMIEVEDLKDILRGLLDDMDDNNDTTEFTTFEMLGKIREVVENLLEDLE